MAMSSSLHSTPPDTSMSSFGGNTVNIAACVDSGMAETAEDDDEAGYRFGNHPFRNGEYVSIRGEDGHMHTFQVVSVEPA